MEKARSLQKKGVTLIELVIVIIIVGVLTGVSALYAREIVDLWRFINFRSEIVSQGRAALMRMEREIRQIGGKASVYAAGSSQLRFHDIYGNDIQYQWLSDPDPSVKGAIMRNGDILVKGVKSLVFTYYDQDNNPIASPPVSPSDTTIKRIGVTFVMLAGDQEKTLSAQIFPRNL